MAPTRFQLYVLARRRAPGSQAARVSDVDAPSGIAWRLLSTNNRDLGRSAISFPDTRSCLAAVRDLQRDVANCVAVTMRNPLEYWSWRLRLDGVEVAVSSRHYQRRVQSQYSSALFLDLVAEAIVVDSPPIIGA